MNDPNPSTGVTRVYRRKSGTILAVASLTFAAALFLTAWILSGTIRVVEDPTFVELIVPVVIVVMVLSLSPVLPRTQSAFRPPLFQRQVSLATSCCHSTRLLDDEDILSGAATTESGTSSSNQQRTNIRGSMSLRKRTHSTATSIVGSIVSTIWTRISPVQEPAPAEPDGRAQLSTGQSHQNKAVSS